MICSREGGHRISDVNVININHRNELLVMNNTTGNNVTEDVINITAATWQNQQNECAPSEDSDQPGRPPSLIRVFAVRSMGS